MKFAVITINTVVTLLFSNDRASKLLFTQLWGVFLNFFWDRIWQHRQQVNRRGPRALNGQRKRKGVGLRGFVLATGLSHQG
jgi:hypothetical protein